MGEKLKFKIIKRSSDFGKVDYLAEIGNYWDVYSPYIVLKYDEYVKVVTISIVDKLYNELYNQNVFDTLGWGSGTMKDSPALLITNLIERGVSKKVFKKGSISSRFSVMFELRERNYGKVSYRLYADSSFIGILTVSFLSLVDLHILLRRGEINYELYEVYSKLMQDNFSSEKERRLFYTEFMKMYGDVTKNPYKLIESR